METQDGEEKCEAQNAPYGENVEIMRKYIPLSVESGRGTKSVWLKRKTPEKGEKRKSETNLREGLRCDGPMSLK